jgi:adenylate cyclase
MPAESFKRKLTAILSADVKGYSRLMGENEAETVKTLTAYRKIMEELIQQHHGRIVDSPGDNILAEFGSVVVAVNCAMKIQETLKAKNADLPENRRMEFRIGVNLGDVLEEEERIYGDGVNIAARLEGLAEAGGICISGTAFDHVEAKLGVDFEYLGEKSVKNIKKPVRVYRVKTESGVTCFKTNREVPSPDKPSIAVLPFTNMSGDPEQEYFSDGITEEIITWLSKIPRLFVTARHSTFVFKDKAVSIRDVGQRLGVRYVLAGSVRKSEDRIRVTAQLIDVETEQHVWADRYETEFKDVFLIQDEVHSVSEHLHAFSFFAREGFALTEERFFPAGPVRMVGHVVEGLRVGHQPEDAACGIADAGNVPERSVWIVRPPAVRRVS